MWLNQFQTNNADKFKSVFMSLITLSGSLVRLTTSTYNQWYKLLISIMHTLFTIHECNA